MGAHGIRHIRRCHCHCGGMPGSMDFFMPTATPLENATKFNVFSRMASMTTLKQSQNGRSIESQWSAERNPIQRFPIISAASMTGQQIFQIEGVDPTFVDREILSYSGMRNRGAAYPILDPSDLGWTVHPKNGVDEWRATFDMLTRQIAGTLEWTTLSSDPLGHPGQNNMDVSLILRMSSNLSHLRVRMNTITSGPVRVESVGADGTANTLFTSSTNFALLPGLAVFINFRFLQPLVNRLHIDIISVLEGTTLFTLETNVPSFLGTRFGLSAKRLPSTIDSSPYPWIEPVLGVAEFFVGNLDTTIRKTYISGYGTSPALLGQLDANNPSGWPVGIHSIGSTKAFQALSYLADSTGWQATNVHPSDISPPGTGTFGFVWHGDGFGTFRPIPPGYYFWGGRELSAGCVATNYAFLPVKTETFLISSATGDPPDASGNFRQATLTASKQQTGKEVIGSLAKSGYPWCCGVLLETSSASFLAPVQTFDLPDYGSALLVSTAPRYVCTGVFSVSVGKLDWPDDGTAPTIPPGNKIDSVNVVTILTPGVKNDSVFPNVYFTPSGDEIRMALVNAFLAHCSTTGMHPLLFDSDPGLSQYILSPGFQDIVLKPDALDIIEQPNVFFVTPHGGIPVRDYRFASPGYSATTSGRILPDYISGRALPAGETIEAYCLGSGGASWVATRKPGPIPITSAIRSGSTILYSLLQPQIHWDGTSYPIAFRASDNFFYFKNMNFFSDAKAREFCTSDLSILDKPSVQRTGVNAPLGLVNGAEWAVSYNGSVRYPLIGVTIDNTGKQIYETRANIENSNPDIQNYWDNFGTPFGPDKSFDCVKAGLPFSPDVTTPDFSDT